MLYYLPSMSAPVLQVASLQFHNISMISILQEEDCCPLQLLHELPWAHPVTANHVRQ